jgi:ABC-type polysaccharide/polyol phosphate transport system ATPase subunit
MDDDVAISLRGAGKRYIKYDDAPMLLNKILPMGKTRRSDLWALRDVSLEVKRGESVGVIGRNGAGKSTMLQILAGVTAPTEGSMSVRGRLAPLVSVGVGFHPELTGRENVYVNGTILGLKRAEIDARFDSIVEFAELGRFIDTPVKFYSSGMYVRLGFSVAVQAEPDILIIDEVLAVGDMAYQVKCFDRMKEIRKLGTTIVLVSHNLAGIQLMCERTVVLEQGQLVFDGRTGEGLAVYHDLMDTAVVDADADLVKEGVPREVGFAEIESFRLLDSSRQQVSSVPSGTDIIFEVRTRFLRDIENPVFNIVIVNADGLLVYKEPTYLHHTGLFKAGEVITCDIRLRADMPNGTYSAQTMIQNSELTRAYDRVRPISFFVAGRGMVRGAADFRARFELKGEDGAIMRVVDPAGAGDIS